MILIFIFDFYFFGVAKSGRPAKGTFSRSGFDWQSSPSYYRELLLFSRHALILHPEPADRDRVNDLLDQFQRKFEEPGGWLEYQRGFNWHLQLWRHQEKALDNHMALPAAGTLYLVSDFSDRCSEGAI